MSCTTSDSLNDFLFEKNPTHPDYSMVKDSPLPKNWNSPVNNTFKRFSLLPHTCYTSCWYGLLCSVIGCASKHGTFTTYYVCALCVSVGCSASEMLFCNKEVVRTIIDDGLGHNEGHFVT